MPHDDVPSGLFTDDAERKECDCEQHVSIEDMQQGGTEEESPNDGDGEHDGKACRVDCLGDNAGGTPCGAPRMAAPVSTGSG